MDREPFLDDLAARLGRPRVRTTPARSVSGLPEVASRGEALGTPRRGSEIDLVERFRHELEAVGGRVALAGSLDEARALLRAELSQATTRSVDGLPAASAPSIPEKRPRFVSWSTQELEEWQLERLLQEPLRLLSAIADLSLFAAPRLSFLQGAGATMSEPSSRLGLEERSEAALEDDFLRGAVRFTVDRLRTAKARSTEDLGNWEEWRERGRAIRSHTIEHLDYYLERFCTNAESAGAKVHFVRDSAEAIQALLELLRAQGARRVVKSKSMVSEELEVNQHLARSGIEVVETDLGEWIIQLADETPSAMFEQLSSYQPMGRMGTAGEVAALALYLCSDEASFITGQAFPIDGGVLVQ